MLSPIPPYDDIRRWAFWEVIRQEKLGPHEWNYAHIKETQEKKRETLGSGGPLGTGGPLAGTGGPLAETLLSMQGSQVRFWNGRTRSCTVCSQTCEY